MKEKWLGNNAYIQQNRKSNVQTTPNPFSAPKLSACADAFQISPCSLLTNYNHYFAYLRLYLGLYLWTRSTCVRNSHCASRVAPRGNSPVTRLLDGYPRL